MMKRLDVRKDVPVCAAALVAAFLIGLVSSFATWHLLGARARGEFLTKCEEFSSLPKGKAGRVRAEELISEIEVLSQQIREPRGTGVWVGVVTGVGFLALSLVAHFFVLAKEEAGAPSRAGEGPGGKES